MPNAPEVTVTDPSSETGPDLHPSHQAIAAQLRRILSSSAFTSSKRSRSLLEHLVKEALRGRGDVKERSIAVDVFGRGDDYDPSADSIVRVSVHELRRRLLRYYSAEGASDPVRIILPQGSYVPRFVSAEEVASHADAQLRSVLAPFRRPLAVFAAFIVVLVLAAALLVLWPSASPFQQFWQPLAGGNQEVIVCFAVIENQGSEAGLRLETFRPEGAEPDSVAPRGMGEYERTGTGAARTLFRLGRILGRMNVKPTVEMVHETSFARVTNSPTVLVGAFNNRLTMEATAPLPFSLVRGNPGAIISREGMRLWKTKRGANGEISEDYAVVVRKVKGGTPPVFIIAGLTTHGTGAAGRFATDESLLAPWLATLPAGWAEKDLEAVIRVQVVNGSFGQPAVVAFQSW